MKHKILFFIILAIFLVSCINNKKENNYVPDDSENMLDENHQWEIIFLDEDPYKLGAKYKILSYNVNLNEEASTESNVIAILNLNDEIEILENSWVLEKLDNVWGLEKLDTVWVLWYKIKFGDLVGYIFSKNIARNSYFFEMDNNSIYCFFGFIYNQREYGEYNYTYKEYKLMVDTRINISIYINNQSINTDVLKRRFYNENDRVHWCEFEKKNDFVLIKLIEWYSTDWELRTVYKMDSNGVIEYLEGSSGKYYGWDHEKDKMDSIVHYKYDKDNNEWWTLEAYEDYGHGSDLPEIGRMTDEDGQTWIKVIYLGK